MQRISKNSAEFFSQFLQSFTKALIENSNIVEALEFEIQETKEPVVSKEFAELESLEKRPIQKIPVMAPRPLTTLPQKFVPPKRITIPEPKLPQRFQNLRPIPTKLEIDLGKINPFLSDPAVQMIECQGADIPLIVKTRRGIQKTNTTLTKEEMDKIIDKFQEITRIPKQEGIYKVAAGRFILIATISEVIGSKFIINKIMPAMQMR